ncbi:MAG: glutamate/tyrosine decarboxylase-like PLP-dependent enzyme [Pseudoalteromonas tetraodonis]|jgi:glutamate/tyrosine decarboxylase-like PLP-dependent enzyme
MSRRDFQDFFLRTGPGGAGSYREALGETIDAISVLFEQLEAPYSGLDLKTLERLLAAEIEPHRLGSPLDVEIQRSIDLVARHSIIVQHPFCAAHLHTPPAIPALAAEVIISSLNQSMDSWDQASAATHIEEQMVDWFANRFGIGERADGTFTSGGTQSNFMGLLLARDETCHRISGHHVFEHGLPDYADRLRVITSQTTHFSIVKSLAQLGLGSRAVVAVDCDHSGRLSPDALSAVLADLDDQDLLPMAVVATAGTTDHGAIDPIADIAEICANHRVWLHVDAAFGGALILTNQQSRLDGIERADSIALDFHKFFYQPISCGLFLLRNKKHFHHLEHHADYLNRESDPRPNLVEKSVATSRRFDALKIWLTLKSIGPEVLGQMIEHVLELTRQTAKILADDPQFELLAEPQLSTVLFRFRPSDPALADDLNRSLHEELLSSGRAIIGRTSIGGKIALKLTLLNPCLVENDLIELVELLRTAGSRLDRGAL